MPSSLSQAPSMTPDWPAGVLSSEPNVLWNEKSRNTCANNHDLKMLVFLSMAVAAICGDRGVGGRLVEQLLKLRRSSPGLPAIRAVIAQTDNTAARGMLSEK